MSKAKIVEIEDGEKIACPRCGKAIIDDEIGLAEQPSCEHVRFIYCNGEAFEFIEPDLKRELNDAEAAADEADDYLDTWEFLEEKTSVNELILEQTQHGMACGPISFTIWVGIR